MTIISADGHEVKPVRQQRFLITIAETYDVLIHVPSGGAYELRATAHDGSGFASVWIGDGRRHPAPNVPRPNLYAVMDKLTLKKVFALTPQGSVDMPDRAVGSGKFDHPGMHGMMSMDMDEKHGMPDMNHKGDHHGMHMQDVPEKTALESPVPAKDMGKKPGMAGMSPMGDHHGMHTPEEHRKAASKGMVPNEAMPEKPLKEGKSYMGGDHGRHTKEEPEEPVLETTAQDVLPLRGGKRFSYNFRPLATDVSSSKNLAVDGMDPSRPWPPYDQLKSTRSTALSKDKPVREIRLTLDGDMDRFVWFINNKPLSESDRIRIRQGEVVRFIMINRTMVHHPMHLHGHFFRVLNDQGDYAPLKHTVDVAPMSTTVIEFDANEVGDWFFHCHVLYHMESGMARVVHYEGYTLDPQLAQIRPKLYHDPWYAWGRLDALSNMTQGFCILSNTRNILTTQWETGWQKVDGPEWETIFTWDRYVNRFFSLFAGADLLWVKDNLEHYRGIFGFRYLLPFSFESRVWVDTEGGARFNLARNVQLTPRLALFGEGEYDTHKQWQVRAGLTYVLAKNASLIGQWHSDYGWGGGLRIQF